MPTALVEARERWIAKDKELFDLLQEAGPDRDMSRVTSIPGDSAAKVAEIQRRNKELDELWDTFQAAKGIEDAAGRQGDRRREMTATIPIIHAGGGQVDGKSGGHRKRLPAEDPLGSLFVESEAFKLYRPSAKAGPVVDIDLSEYEGAKIASLIRGYEAKTTLDEATGYAPQAIRTGLILPGALRRPMVADLIPQAGTTQVAIVYMEETTTTNAAAAVAEGAAKPESALAFTERTSSVRKLATWLPVTDELLADEPAMRGYLEQRLRLFLQLTEENQILSGTGTPPELRGILNTSGINTQAKGGDNTPTAFYKAITLVQTTSFLDPDGIVMHPSDWQDVATLNTTDGYFLWGPPTAAPQPRMWGLPVVVTTAMTQNTGLVGAFGAASQIFRRNEVSFAVSDQHSDYFVKNLLALRVEERLALVVYRPAGFSTVTGI